MLLKQKNLCIEYETNETKRKYFSTDAVKNKAN